MATLFEIRLANEEPGFAAQAAQAAFALLDRLEDLLSRFRPDSEISALARLTPGESLVLAEPTVACLALAAAAERLTSGAFSLAATARRSGFGPAQWTLDPITRVARVEAGVCDLDLGAIGKGFALDRMADELREWGCPAFLLVAGGSSVLAGDPPPGADGWIAHLSDDPPATAVEPSAVLAPLTLAHAALGASGLAFQGEHIIDPATGHTATHRRRAWVQAPTAAEADALSTALMVLDDAGAAALVRARPDLRCWLAPADEPVRPL